MSSTPTPTKPQLCPESMQATLSPKRLRRVKESNKTYETRNRIYNFGTSTLRRLGFKILRRRRSLRPDPHSVDVVRGGGTAPLRRRHLKRDLFSVFDFLLSRILVVSSVLEENVRLQIQRRRQHTESVKGDARHIRVMTSRRPPLSTTTHVLSALNALSRRWPTPKQTVVTATRVSSV